jgi:hypothetical protein
LLGALGRINVPEILLAPLSRRGVDISLALASAEYAKFMGQQGARTVARLGRRSLVRCLEVPQADHAMLLRAGRERLLAELASWLVTDLTGRANSEPEQPPAAVGDVARH